MAAFGNASLVDIGQTLAGITGLAPVFVVPGYLIQRTTRLLGPPDNALDTIGASLLLSIGVCPIALYLIGKISILGTRAFFWLCAAGLLGTLWARRSHIRRLFSTRGGKFWIAVAGAWAVIALLTQIDLQWSNRVYVSSVAYDDALRIGLIGGIARANSLPPPDPFVHLGTAMPLGYHYFWFLYCSLACREAPSWIGPRGATMAGAVWAGLALWASLSMWLRRAHGDPRRAAMRWAVAALVFCISGLDLFVIGVSVIHRLAGGAAKWLPTATLDWWDPDQVTNWVDVVLWVPHGAAALVACATGLLLLTEAADRARGTWAIRVAVAGACFASAVGMSIYVAFGFALFFGSYAVFVGSRNNWIRIVQIAAAGMVALVLAAPYLLETRANTSGQSFLYIGPRKAAWMIWALTDQSSHLVKAIFYAPAVALTLLLELGFFSIALFYWCRFRWPRLPVEHRFLLGLLFIVPLFASSVLRSDAVGTNDLAMRGIFPAQFALAVMAGEWLLNGVFTHGMRNSFAGTLRKLPRPALILLTAGLLTTTAEILLLRTFTMFQEANVAQDPFIDGRDVGLLTADARAAYVWLQRNSSSNTVVQSDPTIDWDFLSGLYANRQCVVNGKVTLRLNRTYSPRLRQAIQDLGTLFVGPGDAADARSKCDRWGVDYLVVKSRDPVWAHADGWIWHNAPLYQSPTVRIYGCSSRSPK